MPQVDQRQAVEQLEGLQNAGGGLVAKMGEQVDAVEQEERGEDRIFGQVSGSQRR